MSLRVDIQRIESGEDEVILRYKEETGKIKAILDVIRGGQGRLYGRKDDERVSVFPGDILYIESVDDKIFAYTMKDVVRLDGTLSGLMEELADVSFLDAASP